MVFSVRVQQCIVNVQYTPQSAGGEPVTFAAMLADPVFDPLVQQVAAANNVDPAVVAACLAIFALPDLQDKPIAMIVELQFYIDMFLYVCLCIACTRQCTAAHCHLDCLLDVRVYVVPLSSDLEAGTRVRRCVCGRGVCIRAWLRGRLRAP